VVSVCGSSILLYTICFCCTSKPNTCPVFKVVYARMEKHLSDGGGLLPIAWKALVKVLYEWFGRWEKLSTSCYKFILEPSAIDVVRLAKAATGATAGRRVTDGKADSRKYASI